MQKSMMSLYLNYFLFSPVFFSIPSIPIYLYATLTPLPVSLSISFLSSPSLSLSLSFSLSPSLYLSLPLSLFLSFSLSIYLSFSYTTFLSHFITVSHYRCLSSSVSVRDVLSSIPFVSIIEGFDPATSGSRSDQAHYHPRLVTVTLIQHSITNITLLCDREEEI